MGAVQFTVGVDFETSPRDVWDAMIDWKGHEAWIPATTVDLDDPTDTGVGSTFTAWTGYRPVRLEDRMRVSRLIWNEGTQSGECEVEKLGPVLLGRAGFTVKPHGGGSHVEWVEDVEMRRLPGLLSKPVALAGAAGFRFGMWRLGRQLR